MKCKLTFTLYRDNVKDNFQKQKKPTAQERECRRECAAGYLTEVIYCAFAKQYNKTGKQCQIKNPGDQLTICKVKERKPTARINKRSETTDQLTPII